MARNLPWALTKKELQRWAFLLSVCLSYVLVRLQDSLVLGPHWSRCLLGRRGGSVRTCWCQGHAGRTLSDQWR